MVGGLSDRLASMIAYGLTGWWTGDFFSGCLADWIDVIQPGWLAGGLATHMAFW